MNLSELIDTITSPTAILQNWKDEDMHTYVVTGFQIPNDPINRIGRVVQVRLEAGQFGSDVVFLRHSDNSLTAHENQMFYKVGEEHKTLLNDLFKDIPLDDLLIMNI